MYGRLGLSCLLLALASGCGPTAVPPADAGVDAFAAHDAALNVRDVGHDAYGGESPDAGIDGGFDGGFDAGGIDASHDAAATTDTGCAAPTDCPSPAACFVATCSAGACGTTPAGLGATCASSGGRVCDGAGACVACNTTADCGGTGSCNASHVCVPPSCTNGMMDGN